MTEPLPPIVLTIETPAVPDVAWAALSEPRRIAEWFTEATPLGAVGDAYRLDFGDGSMVVGVVRLVEPGRRFCAHLGVGRCGAHPGDAGHMVGGTRGQRQPDHLDP